MSKKKNTEKSSEYAPKSVPAYTRDELAGALLYFAEELDETIDAVFLAAADEGFLTPERRAELLRAQSMARIAAETATLHILGGVFL